MGGKGEVGGASPYLAELLLVLGHFLQHLGQVSHGGLWEGSTVSLELRELCEAGGHMTGQRPL